MIRLKNEKCLKFLLKIIIIFILTISCQGQNFSLPNLQILMQKNVIFPNMTLNQQSIISTNNNQKITEFQYKLLYETFVYPFDIYSYMNGMNSKEYLFVRIDYDKFERTKQKKEQNTSNSKEKEQQNEQNIKAQSNDLKNIKPASNDNKNAENSSKINQSQKKAEQQTKNIVFDKEILFQLIPRFLTIHAQQHEKITIKKVNQNFIMVINTANQVQKHQINFFKMITLYSLNIHSYIYYTRQEFLNQFFSNQNQQKEKKDPNSVLGKLQNNFKTLHDIQEQLINLQNSLNFQQKLYHAQDIWYKLFSKNNQLLYRLFYQEARYYINKEVLSAYTFNEIQFKLVTIENRKCSEESPLNLTFSIFQNQQKKKFALTKNCTYMNIFTKVFSTWKDQKSVQFISSQKQLQEIKFVQLAYMQRNKNQNKQQQQSEFSNDLLIGMGNQFGVIVISYSEEEKNVLMYQENTNIKKILFMQDENITKIAFITQNAIVFKTVQKINQKILVKSEVFQEKITKDNVYKEISAKCKLQFLPQILTISQINSQLLAICRQGSYCKVINSNCQIFVQIGFDNAYGVQFSYKVRYIETGKVQIYLQVLKYSQKYREIFSAPFIQKQLIQSLTLLDQTKIGLVYKKYQNNFTFIIKEIKVIHNLTQKQMVIADNSAHKVIIPTFYKQEDLMRINELQLFQDQVYADREKFRKSYLQIVIEKELKSQIFKYFNPIRSHQSFNYLKEYDQERKTLKNANKINTFLQLVQENYTNIFTGCSINILKQEVQFQQNWNMCKLSLTPHSFLVLQPKIKQNQPAKPIKQAQAQQNQMQNNIIKDQQLNKQNNQKTIKIYETNLQSASKAIQRQLLNLNQQKLNYFQKKIVQKSKSAQNALKKVNNLILICSVNLNGQIHQKCLTHKYYVDKEFYEIQSHLRIGLASSKTYYIYFFSYRNNNNQQNKKSSYYKNTMDEFARTLFFENEFSKTQQYKQPVEGKNKSFSGFIENKAGYFFQIQKKSDTQLLYDIHLLDIQKIQIEYMEQLILLMFIVFTVLLVVICCIFMLKNLCFQILIYYEYINVQPAYIYPLGRLPLKIKIKKLIKRGYLTIVKRKNILKQSNQNHTCTKFGQQCCFCLQQINASQDLVQLYCKHSFHSSCFFQWIRNQVNTKCPLCKRQFTQYALRQYQRSMNQLKLDRNQSMDSEMMVEL